MRMCAWDFYFPEAVAIAFWQQNELHNELIKNLNDQLTDADKDS